LRFLLRASGLFLVMLTAWWWLLLAPMLTGLRYSTRAVLWLVPGGRAYSGAEVRPNHEWLLRVPFPESVARQEHVQRMYGWRPGAPAITIHSFLLTIAERVPTFFTLGFPLFWALVLAGPFSRRVWRVLAIGTSLLALVAQLSLLLYICFAIETTLRLAPTGVPAALWGAAEYLNINVVPYVAPLLLAAWLHTELRSRIFHWSPTPEPLPVAAPVVEEEKSRRGRYRGRK
jgi:hypothetical protein